MPSDTIYQLATSSQTVTAAMEEDPSQLVDQVAHKVFSEKPKTAKRSSKVKMHEDYTQEDMDRAEKCGKFPYRPSELFLKIYCDVLDTLEHGPLKNMCSPSLMGSSGMVPSTIVSLVPDIMRYYKDLIVNAQHEVFLATNYWEPSWGAHFIHDAFIELSKRFEGKSTKPVVKLIFDRGNPKQVIRNHQRVSPDEWESLGLPTQDQIPNIYFEAMNYHRPIVGTFHAKYMVIDRRIACVSSNNIQDRVNLEMNIHLEGPIVQAFYDMALLSWSEKMEPPLPLLSSKVNTSQRNEHDCFGEAAVRKGHMDHTAADALPVHPDRNVEESESSTPMTDFTLMRAKDFQAFVLHQPHEPVPIAMVNRAPHGTPGHGDSDVPQNVAWLSGIRLARKSVFIQTPDFNAVPVVAAILDACRRGVECTLYVCLGYNDQGEMLPLQGGTNSKIYSEMCSTLKKEGKRQFLKACWYVAKDRDRPVDASKKERNCHVKFCAIDGQVVIAGNGNQDTQSWFHSQEANVMIDSAKLCNEWMTALNHNQNTALYGAVDEDGVWRDKNGEIVQSSGGNGGPVEVVKGMMNAVARVRGKGGF